MNDSKINKLLKALPDDVKQQFGKSLKKDTAPYRLFKYLTTKKKEDIERTDKILKTVIKTQRKDSNKALGNVSSELYKLLTKWLVQQELEADKLTQSRLLAKRFKRYKASDFYIKELRKTEELTATQNPINMWYHSDALRLAHERYFYSANDYRSDTATEDFTKIVYHLNEFYLLGRLAYQAEQLIRNFNYNEQKTWYQQQKINADKTENPLAKLYIIILKLLKKPDNQLYRKKFLPLLEKYIDELPPKNRSSLLTLQINYAGMQVQQGDTDFWREYYEAYRVAIKGKYFEFEGPLNTEHFMNAMTAAATLGEFEWGRQLIESVPERLTGEVKNIQVLAEALLCLYEKEIETCWDLLEQVDFDSLNYRIRTRSLRAQCGYELVLADKWAEKNKPKEDEKTKRLFSEELEAYRQFMHRERIQIPPFTYDANINFINLLAKIDSKPSHSQRLLNNALRETESPLIAKKWLESLL